MAIARIYQGLAEGLVSGPNKVFVYQQFAEVLVSGPSHANIYQQFAEVLFEKSDSAANVYQQFVEVLLRKDSVDPQCIIYQQFIEVLTEYDPVVSVSDRAYAADGFYADEDGQMTVDDFGHTATFIVSGTLDIADDPEIMSISDLALAYSTFITENPTLIDISDLAYATSDISIVSRLEITSEAIASNKAGTILNGNPGILAENRYPW